jgi:hypothetical protein
VSLDADEAPLEPALTPDGWAFWAWVSFTLLAWGATLIASFAAGDW